MRFKAEDLKEIYFGDSIDGFTVVEKTKDVCEGKYDTWEVIFEHEGKTYQLACNRTGSPYTDYYFGHEGWNDDDEIECQQVEKREKVTHEWVAVEVASVA